MIVTIRVRPGCEDAFAAWKGRHDSVLAAVPGFNSSDIMPPGDHDDTWTILLNFDTREHLTAWQQSADRARLLADLAPLTLGGLGEVVQAAGGEAAQPGTTVTQIIFSRVKAGAEDRYREWAARMQQAQARFPGYRGMFLQPPAPGGSHWITMLRFETTEQLNAWIASPERAAMLKETGDFIEGEELLRLATSFPGWVRIDPRSGQGPPNWKTALLVLLGLYPIVVLELLYLNPMLGGLPPAVGVFIGNVLSVAATSFLTMPYLVRAFDGWLFADGNKSPDAEVKSLAILASLFAGQVLFFGWLFMWHAGRP